MKTILDVCANSEKPTGIITERDVVRLLGILNPALLQESMDAADYATSISKKYNAELYALHVICADVDFVGPHEKSEFMTRMRNEGEEYLNKVKVNANEKNVQIKTEIVYSINIAGGIF